ncbi:MAG: CoA-binding protein [Pseudonocardiaceae bacterium]
MVVRTDHEPWAEPDTIRRILADCQTWAIVGLADHPHRAAHGVARFLQRHGKRVVPVHPSAESVHGEQGYPTLAEIPFAVDCVDVFRRAGEAGPFADQAIDIGAKAVWFQLEVLDQAAYLRTRDAGLDMVMNCCPAIEWSSHGPTP